MPDEVTDLIAQIESRPETSPFWPLLVALAEVAERIELEATSRAPFDDEIATAA